MDRQKVKEFLQAVHIGDVLTVEYDAGFLISKTKTYVGYIANLFPWGLTLTSSDPFENFPKTIFGLKEIRYESIWHYQKLSPQKSLEEAVLAASPVEIK